ncbi:hypothetical protein Pyrfu_0665 [Pyrolobus fumarii 1A]|uniref:Uncharacterized protein n=1 Tax=Pyrolobus fumarii (strain DSM 11204 / 1A) TaxID=694429 RepID=G0EHF9_PYRF1|nr:hypothetical protein [Pyrolobus fumarii]AEM38534.1 hypothetical protein Pyrfu_0665 [Pyrolobus fumarii 1A]
MPRLRLLLDAPDPQAYLEMIRELRRCSQCITVPMGRETGWLVIARGTALAVITPSEASLYAPTLHSPTPTLQVVIEVEGEALDVATLANMIVETAWKHGLKIRPMPSR